MQQSTNQQKLVHPAVKAAQGHNIKMIMYQLQVVVLVMQSAAECICWQKKTVPNNVASVLSVINPFNRAAAFCSWP